MKKKKHPGITLLILLLLSGCWGDKPTSSNQPRAELNWTQLWLGPYAGDPDFAEARGIVSNNTNQDATDLVVIFVLREGGTAPSQYISHRTAPAGDDSLAIVARARVSYLYVDSTYLSWQ